MDPVSLTAAVATLTFTCAKVTKCFHAIKSTYQTAPVTIITMIAECATVSASLNQIQSLVLNDPVALSSRMSPAGSLTKNFEDALTGCMLTLSVIEDELEGMVEGDQGAGTVGFKARAKFVWNEVTMEALLRQLRGQQTAIGLLVAVLQTESIAEVKDMVQKNTATLQTMLQRARTLRESKASHPGTVGGSAKPQSIFSFGMSSTVAGLAPDLSQQLHQSPAYQKARAVEMEDLWRRNHELLQEKYTLLEKIEQLEEQEQKAAEELKTERERKRVVADLENLLYEMDSKLEEKHRMVKGLEDILREMRSKLGEKDREVERSGNMLRDMGSKLKEKHGMVEDLENILREMDSKLREKDREVERSGNMLRDMGSKLEEKHRMVEGLEDILREMDSKLGEKDRDVERLRDRLHKTHLEHTNHLAAFRELAARRISSFEKGVISAIEENRTFTNAALKDRENIDKLESQLIGRRHAHAELVMSQQTEHHSQLSRLLESVKLEHGPAGELQSRPDDEPEPRPDSKPEPGPDDKSEPGPDDEPMYGAPMPFEEYQQGYNPFRENQPAGLETIPSVYEEDLLTAGSEFALNYQPTKETRPIDLRLPEAKKLSPKERASSKPAKHVHRPPPKTFAGVFGSKPKKRA